MKTWMLAGILMGSLVTGAAGPAFAHHAMEFIEMESYSTARAGDFVFHLHYDYMSDNTDNPREDHWELTPGLSYGIANRLMFDIHTHFAKFGPDLVVENERAKFDPSGPSPMMEAFATTLQYRLTDGWPIDIALAGAVEVPLPRAEELLGSKDLIYSATLIAARGFGVHSNVTINLAYEREGREEATTWGLGVKTPLSADPHGIAAGVEFLGSTEEVADNWSVLPGVYMPLGAPNITLKTGIEIWKAAGFDAMRANVTMMYLF
jgi:hypothetical protein